MDAKADRWGMGLRRAAYLVLAAGLLAVGCAETETPEAQVRAALAELEAASEAGDVGAFDDLVSATYQDGYGHDKQQLADFVRFHVLRHPRGREVILRVRDVQLTSPSTASVVAHAGFAGVGESTLHADAYALDLDFALEGDEWRVTWAQWRPAAPAELL
jgi:hypothetical protein